MLPVMPFSPSERRQVRSGEKINEILYSGFYPCLHDQKLESLEALGDYFETDIERDARRIGEIRNLAGFRRFCVSSRQGVVASPGSWGLPCADGRSRSRPL